MPTTDEIYQDIGRALIRVQQVERILAGCLVCSADTSTADSQLQLLLQQDRKTLGCLIKTFQKLVSLPSDFDVALNGLLEARNVFIHRLLVEDWVDLTTAKGRKSLQRFLRGLMDRCAAVGKILCGYLLILNQSGHQMAKEAEEYLKKLLWGCAKTSTVLFDDLPEGCFGDLYVQARNEFAPRITRIVSGA